MSKLEQFPNICSAQVMGGDGDCISCAGEVVLEYEANGPDDFVLVQDGPITCEYGHVQDQAWINAQYDHDWHEMCERIADRQEAAYWTHIDSLIDKRRGK